MPSGCVGRCWSSSSRATDEPTVRAKQTEVYLEVGAKRVFACAYDWPGWCRAGRDESRALEALRAALPRYALVTAEAGLAPPADELTVVERLPGSAATDFGVPGAVPERDAAALTPEQAARLASLVRAAWTVFDRVVAAAPAELRKGPRGGGRDRDQIVEHVYGAEVAYAAKLRLRLRLRLRQVRLGDGDAAATAREVEAFRSALLAAIERPVAPAEAEAEAEAAGRRWPVAYAARRIAWHVLDHAWEIEDRAESVT